MDGVTLVFNKTYYWEAAEIEYLCSNESSNLASNSNGLELRDRRHRSGNDMSERHQGVDESFWFVSNEWDSRKKGHWLRGMRRGRVLCATSFVCLSKAICVHCCRVPRNGFRSNRRFHARYLRRAGQLCRQQPWQAVTPCAVAAAVTL